MATNSIAHSDSATQERFQYTVRGHWPFPADMLRHDGSRAATDADAALIARLSGDYAPDRAAFRDVEINLVGPHKPNTARWESFSWEVPSDEMHTMLKAMARKQQEDDRAFAALLEKLTPDERGLVLERIRCRPS